MDALERKVRAALSRHRMLPAGKLAVVAVSGGADSICLMQMLHRLDCHLLVAHLNHGLRGECAERDAAFVQEQAQQLGLRCTIGQRDVAALRRAEHLSPEEAARQARYEFLNEVAAEHQAASIFLAHTADDQAETFLLRLIRGAGVAGLAAMRPKRGLLCRPMLGIWRWEIENYLRKRNIAWREDASNRDPKFLRNRVRHEVLPLLAELNPAIKEVLVRESQLLGRRQDRLEAELLRQLGLNSRQIEQALEGKAVIASGDRRIEVSTATAKPFTTFDLALSTPGRVVVPGVGVVTAEAKVPLRSNQKESNYGSTDHSAGPEAGPARSPIAFLDADTLNGPLHVRNRRPGDRFVPLGMSQAKKLQDFLVNEKIPRLARDRLPLVTDGVSIVWVAGLRIDDRFKITSSTRRVIQLAYEPEAGVE